MLRNLAAVAMLLFFSRTVFTQDAASHAMAVVNGESIYEDEVLKAASADLQAVERERQAALQRAIDRLIMERVLAAEAAERKMSVEELIAAEANSPAFIDSLKEKYMAKSFMEPKRTAIATAGRPSQGRADAPVTLVEFADFQCPYCGGLSPTLKQLQADYKEKLRIVFLQFPLADIHPEAEKAAEASLCAYEQHRFWELHDAMFGDQRNLGIDELKRKASQLSMDVGAFNTCLNEGRYFPEIRADVNEGVKAGVEGTPAMLINGRLLIGNLPYSEIQKIIEDELRRNKNE